MKYITLLIVTIMLGCSPAPTKQSDSTPPVKQEIVITDSTGTYRQIRPEGPPNEYGARDMELWSKDGVSTNQYIYAKRVFSNGDIMFTRMQP